MIRTTLISFALALAPVAAVAEAPPLPSCSQGGYEWHLSGTMGSNLIHAIRVAGSGAETEYVVACSAGRAVEAVRVGPEYGVLYGLADGMANSAETYTLDDLAKLTRESGWQAKVVNFDKGACVCGLRF
ncbi:MAG: hypothetical protein VX874_20050 [Pseudomonadota bacterium]|nr:hypothetical protein [Pseudomonadota bacterium]